MFFGNQLKIQCSGKCPTFNQRAQNLKFDEHFLPDETQGAFHDVVCTWLCGF